MDLAEMPRVFPQFGRTAKSVLRTRAEAFKRGAWNPKWDGASPCSSGTSCACRSHRSTVMVLADLLDFGGVRNAMGLLVALKRVSSADDRAPPAVSPLSDGLGMGLGELTTSLQIGLRRLAGDARSMGELLVASGVDNGADHYVRVDHQRHWAWGVLEGAPRSVSDIAMRGVAAQWVGIGPPPESRNASSNSSVGPGFIDDAGLCHWKVVGDDGEHTCKTVLDGCEKAKGICTELPWRSEIHGLVLKCGCVGGDEDMKRRIRNRERAHDGEHEEDVDQSWITRWWRRNGTAVLVAVAVVVVVGAGIMLAGPVGGQAAKDAAIIIIREALKRAG